jgi:hypothetical protein
MKKIIPVLLVALLSSSCSETISSHDVPTDQILRSYDARCTNGGTTYITAEFFASAGLTIEPFQEPYGKHITLALPSRVLFNGKEMEVDEGIFGDVCYRARVDGWPARFRWDWTDRDGKSYSDTASMDTISLRDQYMVSRGSDYAVRWEGSPIQPGEEIEVTIKEDEDEFYWTSNQTGETAIVVKGFGGGFDSPGLFHIEISRTLKVQKVKEISVEHVAGSCIKLVYTYVD